MQHLNEAIRASKVTLEDDYVEAMMAYEYGEIDADDVVQRMAEALCEDAAAYLGRELFQGEEDYLEDYASKNYAVDMY